MRRSLTLESDGFLRVLQFLLFDSGKNLMVMYWPLIYTLNTCYLSAEVKVATFITVN